MLSYDNLITVIGGVFSSVVLILTILGAIAVCVVYGRKGRYRIFSIHKNAGSDAEKRCLNGTPHEEHELRHDESVSSTSTVQEDSFDPTSTHTRPSGGRDYRHLPPTSSMQRSGEGDEITVEEKGVQDIKHHVQNASTERYRYKFPCTQKNVFSFATL